MVEVVWRKLALKQLNKAYNYINKESLQSAKKVPEIYPLDKYRKNNDGTIRAFEVYSYRIAYQITKYEIRILRVRHTKREPLD